MLTLFCTHSLMACLSHVMEQAGNRNLLTKDLLAILADRALGNYRAMCVLANELLMEGARKEATHLDEQLFLEVAGSI